MNGHYTALEREHDERWLPAVGWEGFYEVSSDGRVRSLIRTSVMSHGGTRTYGGGPVTAFLGSRGYLVVNLTRKGARSQVFLHRLVLEAFVGPRPPDHDACHGNGDRLDCRLTNLRWDTRRNNHADKYEHGTRFGHRSVKTGPTRAVAIRASGLTPSAAAARFGISRRAAWLVLTGRTYEQ